MLGKMHSQKIPYQPMCPRLENLLEAYVLYLPLPLTFKVKNQSIKFMDKDGIKGVISLNNFDIYHNDFYYGKLISEINFTAPTYSTSGYDIVNFLTRGLTKILNEKREDVVAICYSDDGTPKAKDLKDKSLMKVVLNLLPAIEESIKHYCLHTFGIDLNVLRNFSGSKKIKLSEDEIISLLND